MNSRRLIASILIYAAVFVAALGFSYWRVRALAEGTPLTPTAPIRVARPT